MSNPKLAVIVGRYQTHILHSEQVRMIQNVIDSHTRTILVLGNSIMRGTIANPLDLRARRALLLEKFPKLEILYINDIPKNDTEWSKNLDRLIDTKVWGDLVTDVFIYGSEDTVVKKYNGKYKTVKFEASSYINANELRKQALTNYEANEIYRAGIIAAQANRFPTAYQCVDIAVVDSDGRVLMARKPNETIWRFIGGFSDPSSDSLEMDGRREVMEETGVEVDQLTYLGSSLIQDSRYMFEVDKVKTAFFVAKYIFGRAEAKDDIAETKWIPIHELKKADVGEFHHVLLDMFINKFVKNTELYKKYVDVPEMLS